MMKVKPLLPSMFCSGRKIIITMKELVPDGAKKQHPDFQLTYNSCTSDDEV